MSAAKAQAPPNKREVHVVDENNDDDYVSDTDQKYYKLSHVPRNSTSNNYFYYLRRASSKTSRQITSQYVSSSLDSSQEDLCLPMWYVDERVRFQARQNETQLRYLENEMNRYEMRCAAQRFTHN
jgi:hypothetical protein